MVDNFKLIRDYIKKIIGSGTWKEGDCFYVQLLRRQSDDPLIDGKKDKKYHGNMHSRSIYQGLSYQEFATFRRCRRRY